MVHFRLHAHRSPLWFLWRSITYVCKCKRRSHSVAWRIFKLTWTLLSPPHPHPKYFIPMHTIQPVCVQVDMNFFYPHPTPPQPHPKWPICIFYCGFLRACMVLVAFSLGLSFSRFLCGGSVPPSQFHRAPFTRCKFAATLRNIKTCLNLIKSNDKSL